ncbi:hypothetical protein GS528_16415 [Rhodococcus hoagii]|nr:hypothetical protein [Prescottella equi]
MTNADDLEPRLLHEYDCQDIVEFAHYQPRAHETLNALRHAESTISRLRSAVEYGAAILDKNAAMLDHLVMDTPEDQELNDRVVAVTRKSASLLRNNLEGTP